MGMRVEAAINNTEILYETTFQEHRPAVFKFLLAWTNDWAAAEDLTQEAFVRLWRNRDRVDWSRPVLPWLLVAGRRLATDRFRALRRRVLGTPRTTTLDEHLHDRWLDVQVAMAGLSGLERTAIVLNLIVGNSTAEVAELLDSTPGAIRAAIARGRDKLEAAR
jgi:RNA polymerase sigma-70 factor (ECF subfamily)